jgi:hypothetical protein
MIGAWVAVSAPVSALANVITDWDEKAVAIVLPGPVGVSQSVYMAQRMMGMVHAAMFDAVNSIERRYRPYLAQLPADPATSKEAAAAAAAAAVLATIDEKTAAEMKVALASYLASIPDGAGKQMASSSARRLRQRSWRRGPTMAAMRPMTTALEPRLASMCRRRSPRHQCGQR